MKYFWHTIILTIMRQKRRFQTKCLLLWKRSISTSFIWCGSFDFLFLLITINTSVPVPSFRESGLWGWDLAEQKYMYLYLMSNWGNGNQNISRLEIFISKKLLKNLRGLCSILAESCAWGLMRYTLHTWL